MEPNASLDPPSDPNGLHHCGDGGAAAAPHQRLTGRRNSRVHLNDQRIPKPTHINIQEKMIKLATPKKHPYSSHISQFAMFPSFRSPADRQTGVRASGQPLLSPLVPHAAPDVTLLSKTMGNPYRHEIIEAKTSRGKKALIRTGEHGVLDRTKSLKESSLPDALPYQIPPKKELPSTGLCDLSLSERTCNMLKNLERTQWLTSYQMHYTGSRPANPLKMDNLLEKMSHLTGMDSHSAPPRETYFPASAPSELRKACRRRQEGHARSVCSPSATEPLNRSPATDQGTASAHGIRYRPEDSTAEHIDSIEPGPEGHRQLQSSFGSSEARGSEWSREDLYKQDKSFPRNGRKRENYKVHFVESPTRVRALNLDNRPIPQREMEADEERSVTEQDERSEGGRAAPTRPALRPAGKVEAAGREDAALSLLDLQNSFSKSIAHRNFSSSITSANMNLRDNVVSGKKHHFYGIHCHYLHG